MERKYANNMLNLNVNEKMNIRMKKKIGKIIKRPYNHEKEMNRKKLDELLQDYTEYVEKNNIKKII